MGTPPDKLRIEFFIIAQFCTFGYWFGAQVSFGKSESKAVGTILTRAETGSFRNDGFYAEMRRFSNVFYNRLKCPVHSDGFAKRTGGCMTTYSGTVPLCGLDAAQQVRQRGDSFENLINRRVGHVCDERKKPPGQKRISSICRTNPAYRRRCRLRIWNKCFRRRFGSGNAFTGSRNSCVAPGRTGEFALIYLDNAATTYPKPVTVQNAVRGAMMQFGANPGRSGHAMSAATAEAVYRCREETADFFHAPGPECVVFTLNCTSALNFVIKGMLHSGDHAVTSCLEHNAVMRPLHALEKSGVSWTAAQVVPGDNDATVDAFRKAIRPNTKLIVCTHASNVFGIRLPVERIAALAHQYEIPVAVDCAQSAGVLPMDMADSGIDFLCMPGHKGLYGPMGTGILIARHGETLSTLIEGGTGTNSVSYDQPEELPERFESGTVNVPGIMGLYAGIRYVKRMGTDRVLHHEIRLMQRLYDRMQTMPQILLYTERPDERFFAPVLSFNVHGMESEEVGRLLSERGIAVRAGLHCAPAAHSCMGTLETGTVRVCPSAVTTEREIEMTAGVLSRIARNR